MESINFIKNVSLKKQKAVRAWFVLSFITISISIVGITAYHTMQWLLYRSLRAQQEDYTNQMQQLNTLMTHLTTTQSEHKNLHNQLQAIHTHLNQGNNPAELFKLIKSCLKVSHVESLSLSTNFFEIKISIDTLNSLVTITDTLSQQKKCNGLCITTLEHKDKKLIATLKTESQTKKA